MADSSAELLARYQQQDAAAAEALFHRYAERLARLASSRLSRRLAARVDAEDVVLSAYRSFFMLARDGGVSVGQSGDLWRLLARITLRKVYRNARRHRADCRSVEREQAWSADADAAALDREPTPAESAAVLDELRHALAPLAACQRRIIELHLQGQEVSEITAAVGRSARTVRRTLAALAEGLERKADISAPAGPPAVAPNLASVPYADVVLHRQLGQGGMGKVYRASLRGSEAPVAVKLLRKPLRQHETATARFLQEAELLSRLGHPGIVAIHALGRLPDGGHFLVMDLVEGSDLARRLARGPVAVAEALGWVSDAADAIAHAHGRGVVHCDLKPSNLLLDGAGRIRVSDFGLGRLLAEGDRRPGGGTAGFMAPEQVDPACGPITPGTDVYGLGAVLYALLVGQPPFATDPASSPFAPGATVAEPAFPAEVPASVADFCRRCLAREQDGRPTSAAEVARALRALAHRLCPPRTPG